jgi:hypothetical protein
LQSPLLTKQDEEIKQDQQNKQDEESKQRLPRKKIILFYIIYRGI